jgi:hypothetical protein
LTRCCQSRECCSTVVAFALLVAAAACVRACEQAWGELGPDRDGFVHMQTIVAMFSAPPLSASKLDQTEVALLLERIAPGGARVVGKNYDHLISKDAFQKFMNEKENLIDSVVVRVARIAEILAAKRFDLRVLFARIDEDNTGDVGPSELYRGLKAMLDEANMGTQDFTKAEVAALIRRFDLDGDEKLNVEEFLRFAATASSRGPQATACGPIVALETSRSAVDEARCADRKMQCVDGDLGGGREGATEQRLWLDVATPAQVAAGTVEVIEAIKVEPEGATVARIKELQDLRFEKNGCRLPNKYAIWIRRAPLAGRPATAAAGTPARGASAAATPARAGASASATSPAVPVTAVYVGPPANGSPGVEFIKAGEWQVGTGRDLMALWYSSGHKSITPPMNTKRVCVCVSSRELRAFACRSC